MGQGGTEAVTWPLRLVATRLTTVISHTILGINVIQDGTMLINPSGTYRYEVAAACGGLRSLTVIAAFAVIYGYLTYQSLWRRLILVLAAAPLAVAANVVRLTMIILCAEAFGQKWGNFVHENWLFSLIPYVVAFGGLFFLHSRMKEGAENSKPNPKPDEPPEILGGVKQTS